MLLTVFYVFIVASLFLTVLIVLTRSGEEIARLKRLHETTCQEMTELEQRHGRLRECLAELAYARGRADICARLPRLLAECYQFPFVWIDRLMHEQPSFASGFNAKTGAEGDPLGLGSELSAMVLAAGKGFIYQSRQHSGNVVQLLPSQLGAILSVPLLDDKRPWAVLHLADTEDHPLKEQQTDTLRQVLALVSAIVTLESQTARVAQVEAECRHLALIHGGVLLELDGEGRIEAASPGFEETFGYSEAELVTREMVSLLEPTCTFAELVASHLEGESPAPSGECQVLAKSGVATPGVLTLHARTWRDRPSYSVLISDLRPQRELMTRLEDARENLSSADNAARHFMANINHALRTPLNGIVGMADLLAETELANEQRDYLATLQDALQVLTENLDGLHELAFPLGCAQVAFDPRELLEELADLVAGRFRDQHLHVLLDCAAELPSRVSGPLARLRQTLLHLIGQMVRPPEHTCLVLGLSHQVWNGLPCLNFGMRVEPKLWDREQVEAMLATEPAFGLSAAGFSESGFNLNLARQLARLLQGELRFVEEPESQHLFLRVPFEQMVQESGEAPPLEGFRVIVVETRTGVAAAVVDLLRQCGCRAEQASAAEQALGMLRAAEASGQPCHFVFFPYGAPFSRMLAQGQALSPSTHYLIYSAPNQRLEAVRLLEEGASYCLSLPLKRKRVVELLQNLVRDKVVATGKPGVVTTLPARRLLLVEDNLINQKLMRKVLNTLGLYCEVVDNGAAAVEAVTRGSFDLVLMDINLPLMDGLEATRRIRDQGYTLPILAMTADVPQEVGYCERHGLNEVLTKPIRVRELATTLQHYLAAGA